MRRISIPGNLSLSSQNPHGSCFQSVFLDVFLKKENLCYVEKMGNMVKFISPGLSLVFPIRLPSERRMCHGLLDVCFLWYTLGTLRSALGTTTGIPGLDLPHHVDTQAT